ncbi:MAG: hypothetical protein MP439_05665 [Ferrimicrobium sp.]|nr:hypothetical protein [Ferrimicrobium sp.]
MQTSGRERTWSGKWIGIVLIVAVLIVTVPIVLLAIAAANHHAPGAAVTTGLVHVSSTLLP